MSKNSETPIIVLTRFREIHQSDRFGWLSICCFLTIIMPRHVALSCPIRPFCLPNAKTTINEKRKVEKENMHTNFRKRISNSFKKIAFIVVQWAVPYLGKIFNFSLLLFPSYAPSWCAFFLPV